MESRRGAVTLVSRWQLVRFSPGRLSPFDMVLSPLPAHRTGQALFAHPALGESVTVFPRKADGASVKTNQPKLVVQELVGVPLGTCSRPFMLLGLGQNLMQAIATAKSWLSDEHSLQRLSQLTKVKRIRDQLDGYLKIWESQPLVISFDNNSPPLGMDVRVAQYEFHTMDELEEKVGQFPAGTKFTLGIPPMDSPANQHSLKELRSVLINHGMLVAAEKRVD